VGDGAGTGGLFPWPISEWEVAALPVPLSDTGSLGRHPECELHFSGALGVVHAWVPLDWCIPGYLLLPAQLSDDA